MASFSSSSTAPQTASLVVIDPSGRRTRVALEPLPFHIGRQPESHLVLRDSRISRTHARIRAEAGGHLLEDAGSRHGTFVNGRRITRHLLRNSDRIEFGSVDSYSLIFALDGAELKRLMEQMGAADQTAPSGVGSSLGKLRAVLDLARSLESSFSIDDVLTQVVDTALAVTGAERGFLLLRADDGLEIRVARHRHGQTLNKDELRVPHGVIHHALERRRELLSMNFEPAAGEFPIGGTVAELDLRSVICVPLVRMRAGQGDTTNLIPTASDTVGVLYMDSRAIAADLAGGNRELLQTLAIEASTVLENARLLEEERAKQKLEDEMKLARSIQQSLLPPSLPSTGWLRACGSSVPSLLVGGDYYDVSRVTAQCWSAAVADVSGKGVGSALLASLFEGALIAASEDPGMLLQRIQGLNQFLLERTGGEKYATVFYSLLDAAGRLSYVNAAHCAPLLVSGGRVVAELDATGMPVGLLESAAFESGERQLAPGDKLVIYTDGVTEAADSAGAFFGKKRLRELVEAHAGGSSAEVHDAIQSAVAAFTEGAPQSDDITLVVLEYVG
jgi:sigma-B regulation protein RsbU (phosphoserine phosphatase)